MPTPYEAIPPEQQAAHLLNAEQAVEAAVQPVVAPAVEALGKLVVEEAEGIVSADAQKGQISDKASEFLASQQSVGDEADEFLRDREATFQKQAAELAGEQPDAQKVLADQLSARAAQYDVLAQSNAVIPGNPLEAPRSNDAPAQGGLQNELWAQMASKNKQ